MLPSTVLFLPAEFLYSTSRDKIRRNSRRNALCLAVGNHGGWGGERGPWGVGGKEARLLRRTLRCTPVSNAVCVNNSPVFLSFLHFAFSARLCLKRVRRRLSNSPSLSPSFSLSTLSHCFLPLVRSAFSSFSLFYENDRF